MHFCFSLSDIVYVVNKSFSSINLLLNLIKQLVSQISVYLCERLWKNCHFFPYWFDTELINKFELLEFFYHVFVFRDNSILGEKWTVASMMLNSM